MSSERPIFIVGVGRSGSTIFHHLLSSHPNVAWLSDVSERWPAHPERSRAFLRALDLPGAEPYALRYAEPQEAYRFWDHYVRGFGTPCRDLVASDVMLASAKRIRDALGRITTPRRNRLLLKITGWPRVSFLREIFPDARFIHVLRDGRAVAASLLNVDFWWGWRGPSNWRWGPLTPAQQEEWECHGRSFVALAAIQWKILMDAMQEAKRDLDPAGMMDVRYEDLCRDPIPMLRRATEFAELPWATVLERAVAREGLRSENDKWRRDLTPRQQEILQTVLATHLAQYGYT
jgi:omega-hydroxy-beta-dihydromenaquinone-9 sulfotransferase